MRNLAIVLIIAMLSLSCSVIQYKNMMIRKCMQDLSENDVPATTAYKICRDLYRPRVSNENTQDEDNYKR